MGCDVLWKDWARSVGATLSCRAIYSSTRHRAAYDCGPVESSLKGSAGSLSSVYDNHTRLDGNGASHA